MHGGTGVRDSCQALAGFLYGCGGCGGAGGGAEAATITAIFLCHSSQAKLASRKVLNPCCRWFEKPVTCSLVSSQL